MRRTGNRRLEDDIGVSAEMSRRLACDASKVVITHARDGPSSTSGARRALSRPPSGGRLRPGTADAASQAATLSTATRTMCDIGPTGGTTRLDNLLLVCRRHHRAVHEEGFTVELRDDGEARFFWPDGRPVPVVPPAPKWAGTALASTDAHLETDGYRIDPHTATPDWHGERLDLHWAMTVLHPATADPPRRDVPAGTRSTPNRNDMGAMN